MICSLNFLRKRKKGRKGEMSKSSKCADLFTIANIQEDKEVLGEVEPEVIRLEQVDLLLGRNGVFRQHYCHTEDDSVVQLEQRDQ